MPRKPRIHHPGAIYHVILRGNAGDIIFFNDNDRYYLYQLLDEGVQRYEYRIHGFCLMSNHIHFALQVGGTPLSKIMQNLAFRYARMINKRNNRKGHLFQARYKAILVDSDSYMKELVRYIHLNPVRANLVTDASDYKWSGHRAYLGLETYSWLTTNWLLSFFSQNRSEAINHYRQFTFDDVDADLKIKFHSGNQKYHDIFGDDNFIKQLFSEPVCRAVIPSFETLLHVVTQHYGISVVELQGYSKTHRYSRIRTAIACLARKLKIATLTSVAEYFKRDATSLIHAARLLEHIPDFQAELVVIEKQLKNSGTQA